jgi:hypothetical protein
MSARFKIIIVVLLVIIIALIVFLIIKLTGSDNETIILPTTTSISTVTNSPALAPPHAPSNFVGAADSTTAVMLTWLDNSSDEQGFIIYRNSVEITKTSPDVTTYIDTGLTASTSYQYTIKSYNQAGQSGTINCSVKTLNPPVTVRLDRVGVYDNREDITRGKDGEVYLYVVISDGKDTSGKLRFPRAEKQYYKLAKNEIIDINAALFSTPDVGDLLTLTIIGYENDGEGFEAIAYEALEIAIKAQAGGIPGTLLELFNFNLSDIIGQLMGEADDSLGTYERTWDISNNWGAGQYTDIVCKDEKGVDCLRLWFTISSK